MQHTYPKCPMSRKMYWYENQVKIKYVGLTGGKQKEIMYGYLMCPGHS